ncbi:hypothetical protein V1515DRAFT_589377 [Lipomyces mesembrius]
MSSRILIISCDTCGDVFAKRTALYNHRQNKHPTGTTFKVGETEYDLIQGGQDGTFMCPICGCPVSGKNNLRRHVIKCGAKYGPDSDVEGASEHSQSDDGNSDEKTMTTNECFSLDNLGLQVDQQWRVAACSRCHYIIDPPRIIQHLTKAHKLDIPDMDSARRIIERANLRPHLASDDDSRATAYEFQTPRFLPGSSPVKHLPIYKGSKCLICLNTCTLKKTSMKSHLSRHHPGQGTKYTAVSVQAFYDHGALRPQLSYVEVGHEEEGMEPAPYESLGIPDDLEPHPGDHMMAVEKRDRNLFGVNFGAYHLIENVIDFE